MRWLALHKATQSLARGLAALAQMDASQENSPQTNIPEPLGMA